MSLPIFIFSWLESSARNYSKRGDRQTEEYEEEQEEKVCPIKGSCSKADPGGANLDFLSIFRRRRIAALDLRICIARALWRGGRGDRAGGGGGGGGRRWPRTHQLHPSHARLAHVLLLFLIQRSGAHKVFEVMSLNYCSSLYCLFCLF